MVLPSEELYGGDATTVGTYVNVDPNPADDGLLHQPRNTTTAGRRGTVTAPDGFVIGRLRLTRHEAVMCGIALIVASSIILGFGLPSTTHDPEPWARLSSVIGWGYFMAWSISFLPQIYLNWRRKSVIGQSFDYVFLNVLGFTFYSIYNVSFFAIAAVKEQYEARFGSPNNVEANDVAFALYSLCCCIVNAAQIMIYDRGDQRIHRLLLVGIGCIVAVFTIWGLLLVVVHRSVFFNTLDWLYGLSVVKLGVTVVKYLPQIYLNYKRQLTVGWNVWNVLLDFTGGVLSVTQELIDASSTADYSSITGNLAKFVLGSMSILYDTVFMLQHFFFYRANNEALHRAERLNLIRLQQTTTTTQDDVTGEPDDGS